MKPFQQQSLSKLFRDDSAQLWSIAPVLTAYPMPTWSVYCGSEHECMCVLNDNIGPTVSCVGRAVKLSAVKWYGSGCSFDIIIAHLLLAVVLVFYLFDFVEHSAGWQILQVTRHTLTWWEPIRYMHFTECKKESKGCETYSFWFKFQREVCVWMCTCVCV